MNNAEYLDACTQVAHYLYDEHKSAYGTKGRHYGLWNEQGEVDTTRWTLVQLEMKADYLAADIHEQLAQERQWEQEAVIEFTKLVEDTIAMGAKDTQTALRWILDGDDDYQYGGAGYFEYCNSLPYGFLKTNYPDHAKAA